MIFWAFATFLLSTSFIGLPRVAGYIGQGKGEKAISLEERSGGDGVQEYSSDGVEDGASSDYEPEFPTMSRSIIGRADPNSNTILQNNVVASGTIQPDQTLYFTFPSSALHASRSNETPVVPGSLKRRSLGIGGSEHIELRKRDEDVDFHLTLSVCSHPVGASGLPPPMKLFISWTNQLPGSGTGPVPEAVPEVEDGLATYSNPQSGNVYVGVQALQVPSGYIGNYSFQLVASIDMPYTQYLDYPSLYFSDSDSGAGILVSTNLSSSAQDQADWNSIGPRFEMFVLNQNNTETAGLFRSYCALQNTTQSGGAVPNQKIARVETGLSMIGGQVLKQQFYVSGLNRSSTYNAIMGLPSNFSKGGSGQPGGGGTIWQPVNFTTKSDGNCQIIYNLSFCDQVAYAVPSNPSKFTGPDLTTWYDSSALNLTLNFNRSLEQVACNTTSDAQYSLAVNCTTCKQAYKNWLCAVTMPRCVDYSSQNPYTIPRAINQPFINGTRGNAALDPLFSPSNQNKLYLNSSRNPAIDTSIGPGPYKEVLPCGSLCYDLVKSCPASLGFACPYDPKGYNQSYGYPLMDGPFPQCNIPGAVYGVSTGPSVTASSIAAISAALVSWYASQLLRA